MQEQEQRATRRRRRPPPRISRSELERYALRHLERHPSSRANLRRVLGRRADICCDQHGDDRHEAESMIGAVVDRMTELGFLDDGAYAKALARRMRARGASTRRIALRLHEKGVPRDIAGATLGDETEARNADLAAATIYARRRRLGPHRADPDARAEKRERDLAALSRAGFGFTVAVAVVDAAPRSSGDAPRS
jgi:regulatory protein